MSPQTRGMTGERCSIDKSAELDFRIMANNGIAIDVTGSDDAAETDVSSQSNCKYDYARRHTGSLDFYSRDAVCRDINSQRIDGSDTEKQEHDDTDSQYDGDKETYDTKPEEADCSAITSKEMNLRDETCSCQLTEQPCRNKADSDGNVSLGRQRFDPSLQSDTDKMYDVLRPANLQVNIILPAGPIPDIESCTDATYSAGSSNSRASSSRASGESNCSTPRDLNRSCEDTTESMLLTLLTNPTQIDNNSVEHHGQFSFPGNDLSLENANRFQKYSLHEQHRPPVVATCHLPALNIAGNKIDAIVDVSSFEVADDLPTTGCVLPSIDDRHSVPKQDKHESAVQEQTDLHSVTVRNGDMTDVSHDKVIESVVALLTKTIRCQFNVPKYCRCFSRDGCQ